MMCLVVAYKRLQTTKNYKTIMPISGRSRLRGDRLQEVYSWEDFGVLDRWCLREVEVRLYYYR